METQIKLHYTPPSPGGKSNPKDLKNEIFTPIREMSVFKLRQELRKRGLDIFGSKNELIDRLKSDGTEKKNGQISTNNRFIGERVGFVGERTDEEVNLQFSMEIFAKYFCEENLE